jgi:hypothetical protein
MITHYDDITLDLSTDGVRAEVWAKQDDNGTRAVRATFTDAGAGVSLSSVSSAELRVLRPDGAMVVAAATISSNKVTATFPENALAVGGRGYGDIRLLDSSGNCISAARFILNIEPAAVSNQQVAQSSDFTALLNEYLGGMKFKLISRSDYDALTVKDPDTLYTVTDGSKVTQYLGETELKSGSVTAGIASIAAVGTSASSQGEITQ